jgi:class 3 adenylate cyclase
MEQKNEDFRLSAIMSVNIHDFEKMLDLDRSHALSFLKKYNDVIKDSIISHDGRIIKSSGDEIIADFKNVSDSVGCSMEIQRKISGLNGSNAGGKKYFLRTGIHYGNIWFFENDAIGDAINTASSLRSVSKPGKICISRDVFDRITHKTGIEISGIGSVRFSNNNSGINAYEINTDSYAEYLDYIKKSGLSSEEFKSAGNGTDEESIKSSIINKLKLGNSRIPFENLQKLFSISDESLNSILNGLIDKGIITRIEKQNGEAEYVFDHPMNNIPKKRRKNVADRIEKKMKYVRETRKSLIPNIISYLIFIPVLYFINMRYSPQFWWFLFPAVGWGIGIIQHFFRFIKSFGEKRILENVNDGMTDEQYKYLDRIIETDKSMISHTAGFAAGSALLFAANKLINFETFKNIFSTDFMMKHLPSDIFNRISAEGFLRKITSPDFTNMFGFLNSDWYIYPVAVWGILLSLYLFRSFVKRMGLKRKLKFMESVKDGSNVSDNADSEKASRYRQSDKTSDKKEKKSGTETETDKDEFDKLYRQAVLIKDRISSKIEGSGLLKEKIDSDINEMLDRHIKQIEILISRNREIAALCESLSMEEIEARLENLKTEFSNTKSDSLKNEYEKSIRQCEHHRNSLLELQNQKEILYLKLTSAVMSLKQLEVDMTNMKEIITNEEYSSLKSFEEKSGDLSNYVGNLKQSYRNLERELE